MGTSTRSKFAKLAVDFLLRDDWVCFMNTLRPDLPTEISRKLFDIMDVDHEGMVLCTLQRLRCVTCRVAVD